MKRKSKKLPARRQRSIKEIQIHVARLLERSYLPLVPLGMH